MRQLTSIVARNIDGVIGVRNHLPWRVKSDLSFFRRSTLDNVVIMGRKTHDSLGGCLPKRRNIVVTHGFALMPEGPHCEAASGIEEALHMAETAAGKARQAFVIGGASMYQQFAPFVDRYLITQILKPVSDGDTFFDMTILGSLSDWTCRLVGQGPANPGGGDESPYEIYEYMAKDRLRISARRKEAADQFKARQGRRLHSWITTDGAWL